MFLGTGMRLAAAGQRLGRVGSLSLCFFWKSMTPPVANIVQLKSTRCVQDVTHASTLVRNP